MISNEIDWDRDGIILMHKNIEFISYVNVNA